MTLIIPPLFQLIIFGYAANLDVKHIRTAVRDLEQSVESRDIIVRLGSSKYFEIVAFPKPQGKSKVSSKGRDRIKHEIPSDFSRKFKREIRQRSRSSSMEPNPIPR